MDSAPILLPSPRKSPFRPPYEIKSPFQPPYERELHRDTSSSDEDAYPYEHEHSPDEAVFDTDSRDGSQEPQSPHTSDDDVISEIPTDADSRAPSTVYTPHKRRSPFRQPSSIRNLQLETTPPHLASPSRSAYRLSASPRSRSDTPRSVYSDRSRARSARSSPAKKEKTKKAKGERPLVLLHFTLLPFALPYSQSLLDAVLPATKLADFKLLKEKLSQNVVQERGVLIPHPREDYEVLEERLLEALDLEQGALTRDGHFVMPEERGASRASRRAAGIKDEAGEQEAERGTIDDEEGTEMGDDDLAHLCEDCGRQMQPVGGDRRWDIKIYAANGLMREGAWGAAWHEMERVDVEIHPFIGDETKRDLETRIEELELLAQAEQRELAAKQLEEVRAQEAGHISEERIIGDGRQSGLDAVRMKEIYGEISPAAHEGNSHTPVPAMKHDDTKASDRVSSKELPLSTLLINYARLLLEDKRNVAIGFLSVIAVLLAVIVAQSKQTDRNVMAPTSLPQLSQIVPASQASHAAQQAAATLADAVSKAAGSLPSEHVQKTAPSPSSNKASSGAATDVDGPAFTESIVQQEALLTEDTAADEFHENIRKTEGSRGPSGAVDDTVQPEEVSSDMKPYPSSKAASSQNAEPTHTTIETLVAASPAGSESSAPADTSAAVGPGVRSASEVEEQDDDENLLEPSLEFESPHGLEVPPEDILSYQSVEDSN